VRGGLGAGEQSPRRGDSVGPRARSLRPTVRRAPNRRRVERPLARAQEKEKEEEEEERRRY